MLQRRRIIAEEDAEAQWRSKDVQALRVMERKRDVSERKYIAGLRLQAHEFRMQRRAEEADTRRSRAVEGEKRREERLRAMRAQKREEEAEKSTEDGALARAREDAIRRALVRNAKREAELERANVAKREQRELERRLKEEEAELQKLEDEHARFEQRAGRLEERFLEAAVISAARSKHTHRISPTAMLSATVKEMSRYHEDRVHGPRIGAREQRQGQGQRKREKVVNGTHSDTAGAAIADGSSSIGAVGGSRFAPSVSPVRVERGKQVRFRTPSEESTALAAAVPLPV